MLGHSFSSCRQGGLRKLEVGGRACHAYCMTYSSSLKEPYFRKSSSRDTTKLFDIVFTFPAGSVKWLSPLSGNCETVGSILEWMMMPTLFTMVFRSNYEDGVDTADIKYLILRINGSPSWSSVVMAWLLTTHQWALLAKVWFRRYTKLPFCVGLWVRHEILLRGSFISTSSVSLISNHNWQVVGGWDRKLDTETNWRVLTVLPRDSFILLLL